MKFAISGAQQAKNPEDSRRLLEIASKNALVFSGMIESLIEASETGEGKQGLQEHLPLDLVMSSVDQIVPLAEQKRLHVQAHRMTALPPILADGTRIIRVLVNLLSNAVRFSPEGGRITVSAKTRINDGHAATVFSVADEGLGVPAADIDRIFVEGVCLGQSTGLGLTVCKEIVEAHGGRIWVETGRSRGACFSFSIPTDAGERLKQQRCLEESLVRVRAE